MIQRRPIVIAIAATSTWKSGLGWAQAAGEALRRVGVLAPSTQAKDEITLQPFYDQMRKLGWFEGRNVVYDRVYADDQPGVLSRLSSELGRVIQT